MRDRYFEAAETVFMDGSTPWEVDEALEALGLRDGPFTLQDECGLDQTWVLRQRFAPSRPKGWRVIPLLGRMLELGKLGRKAGAGWYRYPGGGGRVDDPITADLALEESHFERRERTDYDDDALQSRVLLAVLNEAGHMIDAGILLPADLDAACAAAMAWPLDPARIRGSVITGAEGTDSVHTRLLALCAEDPLAWTPARYWQRRG